MHQVSATAQAQPQWNQGAPLVQQPWVGKPDMSEMGTSEHMTNYPGLVAALLGCLRLLAVAAVLVTIIVKFADHDSFAYTLIYYAAALFCYLGLSGAGGTITIIAARNRTQCTNSAALALSMASLLCAIMIEAALAVALDALGDTDGLGWLEGIAALMAVEIFGAVLTVAVTVYAMMRQTRTVLPSRVV